MSFRFKSLKRRDRVGRVKETDDGDSSRFGRSGTRSVPGTPPLERAKTVATGLGQIKGIISQSIENRRGSGSAQQSSTSLTESPASSSRFFKPRHRSGQDVLDKDGEGESFQKFCRGSIKRLRCAGEKVTTAKNDMEEIISSAKSVTDVSLEAKLPLNSPRFDPSRLAEDHALAVEAQDEMKNIITKFVDMLKEEEQQLEVQAELLQRRSSQVNLFPCVQKPPRYDFGDDIDENDDLESPQLSAEGTKVFGAVQE